MTTDILYQFLGLMSRKRCLSTNQAREQAAFWLGWQDLNLRNNGVKVRCLTAWLQPNVKRETINFAPRHLLNGVEDGIRTHDLQCHRLAL